jgi:hypothetical protein
LSVLCPLVTLISQVEVTAKAGAIINAITNAVVTVITIGELEVLILIELGRRGFSQGVFGVECAVGIREEQFSRCIGSVRGVVIDRAMFGSQVAACFLNSVG